MIHKKNYAKILLVIDILYIKSLWVKFVDIFHTRSIVGITRTLLDSSVKYKGDYTKRFFDEEDINNYFKIIVNVEFFETSMIRNEEEYSKPKVLYQVKVTKGED